jgi:hypothetical protein
MTKSVTSAKETVSAVRVGQSVLYLKPARLPLRDVAIDPIGAARLDAALSPSIPALVRSLVDFTIELQNRRAIERGNPQPIQLSVLNRRRRAAARVRPWRDHRVHLRRARRQPAAARPRAARARDDARRAPRRAAAEHADRREVTADHAADSLPDRGASGCGGILLPCPSPSTRS